MPSVRGWEKEDPNGSCVYLCGIDCDCPVGAGLDFGEVGVLIAIILTVSGLFAAFVFLSERLDRMEKKLDALSSKTEKPESDNASNHIGE